MNEKLGRRDRQNSSCPAAKRLIAVIGLVPVLLCGCGSSVPEPGRATVAGTVSLDGAPLKSGSVRFVPIGETKGPAAVAPVKDGKFELSLNDGPVVGQHRIEIEALDFRGFDIDDEQTAARKAAEGKVITANPVPAAYNIRSQMTLNLPADGRRNLDFPLTSQGSPIQIN